MPDSSSQQFLRELDKKLWSAADRLRANLDAAVYKHAVLSLEKMTRLVTELEMQFAESASLETAIRQKLAQLALKP